MVIAISVLIITCPCALALAVPTVQAMASGAFFRAGLFLNNAAGMEKLGEIDTVMFDKTGTLTLPEPRVSNRDEVAPDLLQLAARLARSSHHPLALALARSARAAAPLADAPETAGQGVAAPYDDGEVRLGSAAFCGVEAQPFEGEGSAMFHPSRRALGAPADPPNPSPRRQGSRRGALRKKGLKIAILSGDRPKPWRPSRAARRRDVARRNKAGGKNRLHRGSQGRKGAHVLMVGDGLNDAPSLAAAHASISPIDAVHLTQTQADAVFLGERLAPVAAALAIAGSGALADAAESHARDPL